MCVYVLQCGLVFVLVWRWITALECLGLLSGSGGVWPVGLEKVVKD